MADLYFAIIDQDNIVSNVELIDATDENDGITKIRNNHNNQSLNVVQTWRNPSGSSQRYNFASKGATWDSQNQAFYYPKPFNSWTLDSNFKWQPPVDVPNIEQINGSYVISLWDEENLRWVVEDSDGNITHIWNTTTNTWDSI